MPVTAIRLQNFMGFEDTGWLELRPLTLLFGKNSSGKSAIIRALRLLRQSLNATKETGPLIFNHKDGDDFGSFERMVRGRHYHEPETELPRYLTFSFRCPVQAWRLEKVFGEWLSPEEVETLSFAEFHLSYRCHLEDGQERIECSALLVEVPIRLESDERKVLLETLTVSHESDWHDSRSDFLSVKTLPPSSVKPVFLSGFIPDLFFDPPGTEREQAKEKKEAVPEEVQEIFGVVEDCARAVRDFLKNIHYLGPLRSRPQRYYFPQNVVGSRQSQEGLDVIQDFLNDKDERKERLVSYWMNRLDLGDAISSRPFSLGSSSVEKGYEVQVEKEGETPLTSLREVGYGASQVLPVVLKALFAKAGSLVIVEQPELHLHPAAQVELADLFIHQAVTEDGDGQTLCFLLETHSEHLILRVLKRVRKTDSNNVEQGADPLTPQQISVLYVDQSASGSQLHQFPVTGDGDFEDEWPEGFFSERGKELF